MPKVLNFKTIIFFSPAVWIIYTVLTPFLYLLNWIFIVPLTIYLILVILNSLLLSIKKPLAFPLFILIFLAIHYSYGLGFLIGKLKRG